MPQLNRRRPTMPGVAISGMIVIVLSGCRSDAAGPPLVPAAGVLTMNGSPVSGACILYAPESGPLAHAVTDQNGQFELHTEGRPGAVPGKGKVAISSAAAAPGPALLSAAPAGLPSDPLAYATSVSQFQTRIAQPAGPANGLALPKNIQRLETSDVILHVPHSGSIQLAVKIGRQP